ncbi:MAG: calcium/sodium antiporter [Planctomycetota bacterium]
MSLLFLVLGLAVLTCGAELLVRGASRLAVGMGITPLVVGLTVVAYGTSAPELVVSVQSALAGQSDLALGNVVGSNIFNVLFILGLSALIVPLKVDQKLIRFDVPLMIGLSGLVLALGWNGRLGPLEGLVFLLGLLGYTAWAIIESRRESARVEREYAQEFGNSQAKPTWSANALQAGLVLLGLVLLVLGARWFLFGAVEIARNLGVSELVIGLTIVAAGTSLPEVATSIVAAIRGERDIAVGNVVGSNIFNILGVLGLSALTAKDGIGVAATALAVDIPIMVGVAIACFPVFATGNVISRWNGAVFLGYYIAYTLAIVLSALQHRSGPTFNQVMLWFVIPLTVLGISTSWVRYLRAQKSAKS